MGKGRAKEVEKLKLRIENQKPESRHKRFIIDLKQICPSFRNKVSIRFHEIDRQFVCRRSKEERARMGNEWQGLRLTDIYSKNCQIKEKYGKEFNIIIKTSVDKDYSIKRIVKKNPTWQAPHQASKLEEEEEEQVLDEQKRF